MRITASAKAATREKILNAARTALTRDGWEATTTRAIATAAGIATGTLFNYYASKEALAAALLLEELIAAEQEYLARRRGDESLEEDLFALVWAGFRRMQPYRAMLAAAHAVIFSPLSWAGSHPGEALRARQIAALQRMV